MFRCTRDDNDIKVGDFITVVEWKNVKDNSYKGDCLEVKVIDQDLLRVQRHHNWGCSDDRITLSFNDVVVRRLSCAFVKDCTERLCK